MCRWAVFWNRGGLPLQPSRRTCRSTNLGWNSVPYCNRATSRKLNRCPTQLTQASLTRTPKRTTTHLEDVDKGGIGRGAAPAMARTCDRINKGKMAQRAGRSVGNFFVKLWKQQPWRQEIRNTKSTTGLCDHGRTLANKGFPGIQRSAPSFRVGQQQFLSQNLGVREQFMPRNLGFQNRRFHYTDSRGVVHFKRRGPTVWIPETRSGDQSNQKKILIILGVAGCGSAYVYFNNLQTVPYTHRQHFVLISPTLERQLGEQKFNSMKTKMSAKILPPIHPHAVLIRKIAKDVIEVAMAGTKTKSWGEVQQAHVPHPSDHPYSQSSLEGGSSNFEDKLHKSSHDLYGNEKLEDDMWVEKSWKKGLDEGSQGYIAHLNGLKWEVVVVDEDIMNAFCLPGGKIVVFTGLLKQFQLDTEVAIVLGHEVGHVVARHGAEKLTQGIWLGFLQLIVLSFIYVPGLVSSSSDLLVKLPFSRRMESEADHIGLMLMAAAGYDPTKAPAFYEKMGQLGKQPEYLQYVNTHPSGKKRAEALRESGTMQEAVRIYSEKMAGQGQHGFL